MFLVPFLVILKYKNFIKYKKKERKKEKEKEKNTIGQGHNFPAINLLTCHWPTFLK